MCHSQSKYVIIGTFFIFHATVHNVQWPWRKRFNTLSLHDALPILASEVQEFGFYAIWSCFALSNYTNIHFLWRWVLHIFKMNRHVIVSFCHRFHQATIKARDPSERLTENEQQWNSDTFLKIVPYHYFLLSFLQIFPIGQEASIITTITNAL